MAEENSREDKNPFSFKSFVKNEPNQVNNNKEPPVSDVPGTGVKKQTKKNPFSFTTFLNEPEERSTDSVNSSPLSVDEAHFGRSDKKCKNQKQLPTETKATIKENLADRSDDSDLDFSDDGSNPKDTVPSKIKIPQKNRPLPSLSLDSDSDDFTVDTKPKITLLPELENKLSTTILEDLSSLSKPELLHKFEQIREEHAALAAQYAAKEECAKLLSTRIEELEKELVEVRKKEAEDTAALELIIQQVEDNLKRSMERSSEAENKVKSLKQEMKTLQSSISTLQAENQALRTIGGAASGAGGVGVSTARLQTVADQINTAAGSAEQSLKQLLGGVESLRLISRTLVSLDKFSELPPDPPP